MSEIVQRSLMPVSAEELLAWHARPGAFERLMPPWERIELRRAAHSLTNGERAEFVIPIGPFRKRWVAEHHALADGIGFRDVQIIGPFARWEHTHRMTPAETTDSASWLGDCIHYDVPLSFVGRVLLGRHIRQSLERTFA
jgi:ligand-binding SRPBCC domain-containing protein